MKRKLAILCLLVVWLNGVLAVSAQGGTSSSKGNVHVQRIYSVSNDVPEPGKWPGQETVPVPKTIQDPEQALAPEKSSDPEAIPDQKQTPVHVDIPGLKKSPAPEAIPVPEDTPTPQDRPVQTEGPASETADPEAAAPVPEDIAVPEEEGPGPEEIPVPESPIEQALTLFQQEKFSEALPLLDNIVQQDFEQALEQQHALNQARQGPYLVFYTPQMLENPAADVPVPSSANVPLKASKLNAVAAAFYLQAEINRIDRQEAPARKSYQQIVRLFPGAYQKGPHGWCWNIAELARDKLETMGTRYYYNDYSSPDLIKKAWRSLNSNDLHGARLYAQKWLRLYDHAHLPQKTKGAVAQYILGAVAEKEDNKEEARRRYARVADYPKTVYPDILNYPYYNNLTVKAADRMKLMGKAYDFGNYTSETLTIKAWRSWDKKDWKGVKLYAQKCIDLYADKARAMQDQMDNFAPEGITAYSWALNDVGTCTFILGLLYEEQQEYALARSMYTTVMQEYAFAQCWNPQGFYWKVAEACRLRMDKLPD